MLPDNVYKNGTTVFLIKRYVFSLLLFTLARVVFYIVNLSYFNNIEFVTLLGLFAKGIYFDMAAVAIVNSLFILFISAPHPFKVSRGYRNAADALYFIPNIIALVLNFGDSVYYPFTLKRLTSDIFTYLQTDTTSVNMLPKFLFFYWPVTVICLAIIYLFVFLTKKYLAYRLQPAGKYTLKYFGSDVSFFFICIVLSVIMFRGGLQLKPVNIINAGQFAAPEYAPFILNTPFTLLKTIDKKGLPPRNDFPEEALEKIYSPVSSFKYSAKDFRKLNVVIIILESFSSEHLGYGNGQFENGTYKGYTPFLDSLIKQSLYFSTAFANGKRSIEGIPPLLSGVPTYMEGAYITSPYAGNTINSIASLLKPFGYTSSFYHGGFNGTMGFNSFTTMAKIENYYGKSEYPDENDYDGNWGISDEPYMQYFAKQLAEKKQPFVATLFTLSSHQPYIVPKHYKGESRKGNLKIQPCVLYTDQALRKFFKTVSKMPWFDSTLFVISADHCSEAFLPYYQTRVGNYRIPILFYQHNSRLKGVNSSITQQTDVMPSILDYMRYPGKCLAFGSSVFDTTAPRFAVSYLNGSYLLLKDDRALQFDGIKSTAMYSLASDSLLKNNILSIEKEKQLALEKFLRAFLQQYNNRLINNKLTVGK